LNHLEINELEKRFSNIQALNGVNMAIPAGQIVGLLGPNASGKTTLLKTVAGLQQPTGGSIKYSDNANAGEAARSTISFCPDVLVFPSWMRVRNAFEFYSDMYPDYSQERADKLVQILELNDIKNSRISKLSKGMKERLALAVSFSRETKLYMLDEPLDGIDPVGKVRVIDAILALKPDDASVLVSTHLVRDIERIFDSVHFLSRGKIVFSGACDDIRENQGKTVEQMYLEVFISEGSF
jgi:ABC-2 type transport system ATP-binding protein